MRVESGAPDLHEHSGYVCYACACVGVTFADLRYRYRQFLIAVVGAGLVLAMALLLAGLVGGFAQEINWTVAGVGAQRWVLTDNSHGGIAGSGVLPQSAAALITRAPGVTSGRTILAGTPIVYVTLRDAQALAFEGRPLVTAVVTRGIPATLPAGLAAQTNQEVEQSSLTNLAGATSSINNSKIMMWVVAAIIVAALLYVSALQRVRDFAVLKALGSSSAVLFGSLALQAVVVTLLAAAFAMVISVQRLPWWYCPCGARTQRSGAFPSATPGFAAIPVSASRH